MSDTLDDKDKYTQTYTALSIGLVCLLLGFPLWWKTTEIYRVQLPYSDIARLSQTRIMYAVEVEVISFDKLVKSLPDVTRRLQEEFAQGNGLMVQSVYRVQVRDATDKESKLLKDSKSLEELDVQFWDPKKLQNSKYTILLIPGSSPLATKQPYLGSNGNLVVTDNQQGGGELVHQIVLTVRDVLVREGAMEKSFDAAQGLRTQKPDKESMRWVRSQPGYDVTFTLINPQPDLVDVQWNIQGGIHAYLDPFLNKLANFTTVSVTSQVLHYVGLVISPNKDSSGSYYYTEHDLPHLINPLESKLGSHASSNPNLNFVVYVPTRDNTPLYIQDENGERLSSNAFLSPRWGGIMIYNADVSLEARLPAPVEVDMKKVMEVFLTQLRLLLNIQVQIPHKHLGISQLQKYAIADWELSGWLRCRCIENLATAKASLQSLSQLLGEIGNIVINDEIGQEVEDAVSSIQLSQGLLAGGHLQDAYLASRHAVLASEKAFFDPSLLELLYFPEDQKFAIYIPLFLPISIPVIMSLLQAIKWLRQHRQKQKEQ